MRNATEPVAAAGEVVVAIPRYMVLLFLDIAAMVVVIVAWFTIVFTGRCSRGAFDVVEGVICWHNGW